MYWPDAPLLRFMLRGGVESAEAAFAWFLEMGSSIASVQPSNAAKAPMSTNQRSRLTSLTLMFPRETRRLKEHPAASQ